MKQVKERFSRWYNKKHSRRGTLWLARFTSVFVENGEALQTMAAYIDLNPVRAGMVTDPANYSWSSYRAHAFGKRPAMWKPHDEYLALGSSRQSRQTAYRQLVAQQLPSDVVTDIRDALNTGLVLGSDCFRELVQTLTGVRQQHLKRGPQPGKLTIRQA